MEIKGKYSTAKIFTNVVDDGSINQVKTLCDQEFTSGSKIRMMPDIHAGAGCTIGTTMTIKDKIVPNLVGVDISCGMLTVELGKIEIDFQRLDRHVHQSVPSGFNKHNKLPDRKDLRLSELKCSPVINIKNGYLSIGTLGGGNHFIEVDKDDNENMYLVIHTGSRHTGLEVACYYQKQAIKQHFEKDRVRINEFIQTLKDASRHSEIPEELKKFREQLALENSNIPQDLCYVEGALFDDYIHDMNIMTEYACKNRQTIAEIIIDKMGFAPIGSFETLHNYIDTKNMILRKGAVSAQKGERLLIPINMRDGSLICIGKGNEDWNYSAPHGAGRIMSRSVAFNTLTIEEFQESMKGIYSTSIMKSTIDESPMAYKGIDDIVNNIGPTADIEKIIKPVYNFKATE